MSRSPESTTMRTHFSGILMLIKDSLQSTIPRPERRCASCAPHLRPVAYHDLSRIPAREAGKMTEAERVGRNDLNVVIN